MNVEKGTPPFGDAVIDAVEALAVSMRGSGEVIAAIELLDRQRELILEVGGAYASAALSRLDEARQLLGELRRRIQTARR